MGLFDKLRYLGGDRKTAEEKRLKKFRKMMPEDPDGANKPAPIQPQTEKAAPLRSEPLAPAQTEQQSSEMPDADAAMPEAFDESRFAMKKLNLSSLTGQKAGDPSASEAPLAGDEAPVRREDTLLFSAAAEDASVRCAPEAAELSAPEAEIPIQLSDVGLPSPVSEKAPLPGKAETPAETEAKSETKAETKKSGRFGFLRKKIGKSDPETANETLQPEAVEAAENEMPEEAADNRSPIECLADQIQTRYPNGIKSLYSLQSDMQFCVEIPRVMRNQKDREELKGLLRERKLLQTELSAEGESDGVTEVTSELFEQFMNRLTDDNQGMLFSYVQAADSVFFRKTLPLYEDFCAEQFGMPLEDYLVVRRKLAASREKLEELGQLPAFRFRCPPDSMLEQYAQSNDLPVETELSAEGHLRRFHRLVRVVETEKDNRCYACLKLRLFEGVSLLREPEGRVAVYNRDNELCGYVEEAEQQWICSAMEYEKVDMPAPVVVEHGFLSPEGKLRRRTAVTLYFSVSFDERKYVLYAQTHFEGPKYFAPAPKEPQKSPEGYFALNLDNTPENLTLNTRRVEGQSLRSRDDLSDWSFQLQSDGTVVLKNYSGRESKLTLPSEIDGWPVTKIAKDAFSGLSVLTHVRIPGSIREIGENAFRGCGNLYSVSIGEGCEKVGRNAFSDCSALEKVVSPASLCRTADATPFSNTPWRDETNDEYLMLGSVLLSWQGKKPVMRMPGGIRFYGRCAAAGCPELREVIFPDGMEEISEQAFYPGNKLLETVTVPLSVRRVGENAFRQTKWLSAQAEDFLMLNDLLLRYRGAEKTVHLSENVHVICDGAFRGCGIDRLWLEDSLTDICDNAFRDCASLRSVSVGNGLRRIGDSAFSGCRALTEFFLPEKIESVGERAFWGCSMLEELQYPKRPIPQGKDAFVGTPHILKFGNMAVSAGKLVKYMGNAPSVKIPEGVVEIGPRTFAGLRNLVSVELPESLQRIDREAFADCVCLDEVTGGAKLTDIAFGAFSGCSSLRKFPFQTKLRSIGDRAFLGTALQNLTMPKSLEYIGRGAFGGKSKITVYDAISPEAQRAGVSYDLRMGSVNAPLSCALLTTNNGELLYDSDTTCFAPVRITVRSVSTDSVKHSFYFDGRNESRAYRAFILSCWAKKGEMDWTGFDKVFMKIRNPVTRLINAYDRLKDSPAPEEDQKTFYQNYLRRVLVIPESFSAVSAYIMENDDKNLLALLQKLGAVTEENRTALLQAARDKGAEKCGKVLQKP